MEGPVALVPGDLERPGRAAAGASGGAGGGASK